MIISDFNNKTVIITGASAGVGAACARAFAALAANLVLVARGKEALDKISNELSKVTEVLSVSMDVADTTACLNLADQAFERFGRIDVLINNAGMHVRGDVIHQTPQAIAAMVDVNVRAPLVLTSAVLPHMHQSDGGAIVMVGSLAGMAPLQGAATYSGTKAGLRAFTYALADELQETNINVGVVSPGPIDTGFIMDNINDVEDIVYSQPMSTAEEVAESIIAITQGNNLEIAMPQSSGWLATLGYLLPSLRRKLRPALYKKGRKNKDKYRHRAQ